MRKGKFQWMFMVSLLAAGLAFAGCRNEAAPPAEPAAPAEQGAPGAPGAPGAQGAQGDQGYQGAQGAQGNQGDQGNQGNQGAQGDQGNQGARGVQGAQGARGSANYNFDVLCKRAVDETKAAVGNTFTDQLKARTMDSCMGIAQAYARVPNPDAAKSAYAKEILTTCEGRSAQDWLNCYAGEAQNAGKAATDAMNN